MGTAGVLMFGAAVWVAVRHSAPEPPAAGSTPVRSESPAVALFVQHDGAALRLHWNPDSDAIRRASGGALVINDGPRHSRLNLSPAELSSGVASYWPESPGVDFQLELDGAVAGELHVPALAIREEPRPSPFEPAPRPKRAVRRPAVGESDSDMPKPHTERAAGAPGAGAVAPARHDADRASEQSHATKDAAPKRSRWNRVTGKIPLLRRLHRQ